MTNRLIRTNAMPPSEFPAPVSRRRRAARQPLGRTVCDIVHRIARHVIARPMARRNSAHPAAHHDIAQPAARRSTDRPAARHGTARRTARRASVAFDERTLPLVWLGLMLGAALAAAAVVAWPERGPSSAALPAARVPQPGLQAPAAGQPGAAAGEDALPLTFPIYLAGEDRIASVSLEQYVRGVVAAEMPIEFELEALKAQAIAARTYIARRFAALDVTNVPVPGAWVTDTVSHQAYLTDDAILDKWTGPEREANLAKLDRAVRETRNLIMTFDGEPILAVYFSTSNGYTENSEDYWSEKLPYLRSVESRWDESVAPAFRTEIRMAADAFAEQLGIDPAKADEIRVLERSQGRRVKQIRIGGQTFTGRDVREKLGLPSTAFSIRVGGGEAVISAAGHGHGVGMSQYGAQGMALAGYRAEDILLHYFSGVRIERYRGPDPSVANGDGQR